MKQLTKLKLEVVEFVPGPKHWLKTRRHYSQIRFHPLRCPILVTQVQVLDDEEPVAASSS